MGNDVYDSGIASSSPMRGVKRPVSLSASSPSDLRTLGITQNRGQVLVLLDELPQDISEERRQIMQEFLAIICQVEKADVRIRKVESGSVRLTVEVPDEALWRLTSSPLILDNVGAPVSEQEGSVVLDLRRGIFAQLYLADRAGFSQFKASRVPKPYQWPRLWPDRGEEEDYLINRALNRLGWDGNPFGPERAEDDPRLTSQNRIRTEDDPRLRPLFVEPPAWQLLQAMEPTILLVPAGHHYGYGQTAAFRGLVDQLRRCSSGHDTIRLFPIYEDGESLLGISRRRGHLNKLSYVVARHVLNFLELNPRLFMESPPDVQRGILRLLAAHYGQLGDVTGYLVGGLEDQDEAVRLAAMIADVCSSVPHVSQLSEPDLRSLLAEGRLGDFQGYCIAIDFSRRYVSQWESQKLASHLQPLIDLMPMLAAANVFLKIGVSRDAALFDLDATTIQVRLGPWPPEVLQDMANARLEWVTGQRGRALSRLFEGGWPIDVLEKLVTASDGSPQQLIRLGNMLLTRYGEKGAQLTTQDLEDIIERFAQPLSTWQTELRQKMTSRFGEDDLRNLCVDLALDYENLQGGNKEAKTRNLIATLERNKRLPELIARCRQLRPSIAWDLPPAALEPPC